MSNYARPSSADSSLSTDSAGPISEPHNEAKKKDVKPQEIPSSNSNSNAIYTLADTACIEKDSSAYPGVPGSLSQHSSSSLNRQVFTTTTATNSPLTFVKDMSLPITLMYPLSQPNGLTSLSPYPSRMNSLDEISPTRQVTTFLDRSAIGMNTVLRGYSPMVTPLNSLERNISSSDTDDPRGLHMDGSDVELYEFSIPERVIDDGASSDDSSDDLDPGYDEVYLSRRAYYRMSMNRMLLWRETASIFGIIRGGNDATKGSVGVEYKPSKKGHYGFLVYAILMFCYSILGTVDLMSIIMYQHGWHWFDVITLLCLFFFGYCVSVVNLICFVLCLTQNSIKVVPGKMPTTNQSNGTRATPAVSSAPKETLTRGHTSLFNPKIARGVLYLNYFWVVFGLISSIGALIYFCVLTSEGKEFNMTSIIWTFVPLVFFLFLFAFRKRIQYGCYDAMYVMTDEEMYHGRWTVKANLSEKEVAHAEKIFHRIANAQQKHNQQGSLSETSDDYVSSKSPVYMV